MRHQRSFRVGLLWWMFAIGCLVALAAPARAATPVPRVPETVPLSESDVNGRRVVVGVPLRVDVGAYDDFIVLDPHILSATVVGPGILELQALAPGQGVLMVLAGGTTRAITLVVEAPTYEAPLTRNIGSAKWRYQGVGSYGVASAFGEFAASWQQVDLSDGGLDPDDTEDAHLAVATQQDLVLIPLMSAHLKRERVEATIGDTALQLLPGNLAMAIRGGSVALDVGERTTLWVTSGASSAVLCCDLVNPEGEFAFDTTLRQGFAEDAWLETSAGLLAPLQGDAAVPMLKLGTGWSGPWEGFGGVAVLGEGVSLQGTSKVDQGDHGIDLRVMWNSRGLYVPRDGPTTRTSLLARSAWVWSVRDGIRFMPLAVFTSRGAAEGFDDERHQLTAGAGTNVTTLQKWDFDLGAYRSSSFGPEDGFFGSTLGRVGFQSPYDLVFGGGTDLSVGVTDAGLLQSAFLRSHVDFRPVVGLRTGPEVRAIATSTGQVWAGLTADYLPRSAFSASGELGYYLLADSLGSHTGLQGYSQVGYSVLRNAHLDLRGQTTLVPDTSVVDLNSWRVDLVLSVDGSARTDRIAGLLGLGGRIEGDVFLDGDLDGVRDPMDEPVSGVPVKAFGRTHHTDEDGTFSFRNVAAGPKDVSIERGDFFTVDGTEKSVTVEQFGVVQTSFALSLGARIETRSFHDANRDGRYQPGENGVDAGIVTFRGPGGRTWQQDAPQGLTGIANLKNGIYTVEIDPTQLPVGWIPVDATEETLVIDGSGVRSVQFPLMPVRTITGQVWVDVNQNARLDGADRLVEGAVVRLEPGGASTTDASGRFLFDDVRSGVLTLSVQGVTRKVTVPTTPTRLEHLDLALPEVLDRVAKEEQEKKVVAVRILPGELFQRVGEKTTLKVTAFFADLSKVDVTAAASFVVSDPRIARIEGGTVEGLRTGHARVDASWNGVDAPPLQVEVGFVPTAGIEVRPREVVVEMGDVGAVFSRMLYVTGDWVDATELTIWTSSDPAVATVDRDGVLHGVGPGTAEIRGDLAGQRTPPVAVRVGVERAFPASLAIRPPGLELSISDTGRLEVEVALADGRTVDGASFVRWEVVDASIAEVLQGGRVVPHKVGETEVSVSWKGVRSPPASLRVLPPEGLLVGPPPGVLPVGQEVGVVVTAILRNGTTQQVEDPVWSVAEPGIVTLAPNGRLKAIGVGTTTITAEWRGTSSSPVVVEVVAEPFVAVEITPSPRLEVRLGRPAWVDATAVFASGRRVNATPHVTFEVGDTSILAVGADGSVEARTEGATLVRAVLAGVRSTPLLVTVREAADDRQIVRAEVVGSALRVLPRETATLSAEVVMSDGERVRALDVIWRSEDRAVAIVDTEGHVKGVSPGVTRITADVGGVRSSPIEVSVPLVAGMTISPPLRTVPVGAEVRLSAEGVTASGDTVRLGRSVDWSSTDERVAWVDRDGLLHTIRPGDAEIRAVGEGFASSPLAIHCVDAELANLVASTAQGVVVTGDAALFEAEASFTDGSAEDSSHYVVWSSSRPEVLDVVDGFGTTGRPGEAQIYATWLGERSSPVTVRVLPAPLAGLALNVPSVLLLGADVAADAQGVTVDGRTLDLGATVTWTTSDPNVVRLDGDRLRAVGTGEATVNATLGETSRAIRVEVRDGTVTRLSVSPAQAIVIGPGEPMPLEVTATLADGSSVVVTGQVSWRVEGWGVHLDQAVLTLDEGATGVVQALWGTVRSDEIAARTR